MYVKNKCICVILEKKDTTSVKYWNDVDGQIKNFLSLLY